MKSQVAYSIALTLLPLVAVAEDDIVPVAQEALNQMVTEGEGEAAFLEAFELGDELTEFSFDAARGVGANIGEGRRFTRFPRADLDGPEEWANHYPTREGGANATSCIACHNAPFANGAGDIALNVVVDPAHTGDPSKYLERNTLPLFALGVPQKLAEEMSLELYLQRTTAEAAACSDGQATAILEAKGVSFGTLEVTRTAQEPCVLAVNTDGVDGVDPDLVVKAFGWKGNQPTIRAFTRGAAHNELGLQAVELVGDMDGDFDGVTDELTVGDMTALTIYMAALERPVSTLELDDLGLVEMDQAARDVILAGKDSFSEIGCASCHVPQMTLADPVFQEPSNVAGFYDVAFPDGSSPAAHGLASETAISFDLMTGQPNNQIETADGQMVYLGGLRRDETGAAVAEWYTDLKRHDMGAGLADPDDPLGIGASVFLTRSLAGVGVTGPWLHDGRATSLEEAIAWHGGDAADSAVAFSALDAEAQSNVIAFLESLVMYQAEGDDH